MSHFSVMVLTASKPKAGDLERVLQPWHEFECTGVDDRYVVDVDRTADVLETAAKPATTLTEALDHFGLEDRVVTDESEVDRAGLHKYGYAVVRNGALIRAVDRTNPNSKWDWWVVGGRWSDWIQRRGAGSTLQLPLADVDWVAMRRAAANREGRAWDAVRKVAAPESSWETWDAVLARFPDDVNAARLAYWDQPAIRRLRADGRTNVHDDHLDDYLAPRDAVRARAASRAIVPFALVDLSGTWHERGQMGWWATVSGEKHEEDWWAEVAAVLSAAPPETWVMIVDGHI